MKIVVEYYIIAFSYRYFSRKEKNARERARGVWMERERRGRERLVVSER